MLDPARAAALDVLKAVRVDRAYANLVLPAAIRHYQLEGRDAAFATELASGTIRRRGTYDAILAACIDRPLSKVESKVLDALRVGTHQLLSMRVPDHAAISTTVDLVRARVNTGAGNFANAVLRSVSERDFDEWIEKITPDERASPTRYAALAFSHPEWVVDELREAVGRDELHELLAADNENPRVTLVARPGPLHPRGAAGGADPLLAVRRRVEGGDPRSVPAVAEGRAGVQDEGSQLVALALAEAPLEGRDELWLDLCAGPGGKAGLLAALASERGARLVASERLPVRAGLVRRTLTADGGFVPGRGRRGRRRRDAGALPCRHLRPGARRRALHRAGRAAPPPRGAVAAQARRPARAGDAAAPAGPRGPRPGPARRRGPLRDLLTGDLGDRRTWSPRCRAPASTPSSRTSARSSPACLARRGRSPAPSSSGRTGTAPTRCSWRCSAGPSPSVEHVPQVAPGRLEVGLPVLDQLQLLPRRTPEPQSPTSRIVAPGIAASTGECVAHSTWPPSRTTSCRTPISPSVELKDSAASGSSRQ